MSAKWGTIFPKTVPHNYACLTRNTRRTRDLKDWFVVMFCAVCKRQTNHQRVD